MAKRKDELTDCDIANSLIDLLNREPRSGISFMSYKAEEALVRLVKVAVVVGAATLGDQTPEQGIEQELRNRFATALNDLREAVTERELSGSCDTSLHKPQSSSVDVEDVRLVLEGHKQFVHFVCKALNGRA